MGKVKLTREQAEVIEQIKKVFFGKQMIDVSHAVHFGYEVEEEFKVGDWVTIADGNAMIGEVYKIDRVKDCAVLLDHEGSCWWLFSQIRHATPEEIKAEQERRVWAKTGRKVGEFKDGDIGVCEHIYWNDPDDLKNLYKEGILENFYPVESRISFGGGEE